MKRDLLLLFLCLCILGGAAWMGRDRVVSAVTAPVDVERVLILDAGHGGEDGGASSASGKMESGINLDIVLKTEALMAFLGVRTELTRSEDRSMHSEGARTIREKKVSDLKNRAAFISGFPNAMLISVHQNHFTDTRYSGAQTFYSTGDTSRQWGEGTQEILRQTLDRLNVRRAKPMPDVIYLFEDIMCPAILVECGFLSNGEEAALLCTDAYQRRVAVALAGAYFAGVELFPATRGGT